MIVLLLSVAGFVLYLLYERVTIDRWRKSVPQTIIVTGTRGKSSVTRMLASVLKADGRKVLAKMTGSLPKLVWPDGSETEIRRRGPASILEQKTLLKHAASLNVDCVVAEVMSIHPDNHIVESRQILRPDIVVVTNTWPDHIDAQGKTEEEVAATLCLDIAEGATVFVPSTCTTRLVETSVNRMNGKLIAVEERVSTLIQQRVPELASAEFSENVDLVYAVAKHLELEDDTVVDGLATASRDVGALALREFRARDPEKRLFLVNAFAANDPTSTFRVLAKARELLPDTAQFVGLLCLRSDRADRTQQWLEVLGNGAPGSFNRLYVTGGHARVVERRLASARVLKDRSAKALMESLVQDLDNDNVVFGFGNIGGMGHQLVEYWNRAGVAYGL